MTTFGFAIKQNAQAVADLDDVSMRSLLGVLERAREDTARAIFDWLKTHKDEDQYTIAKHRSLIHQLDETMGLIKNKLGHAAKDDVTKEAVSAMHTAGKHVNIMVETGREKFLHLSEPLHIDMSRLILDEKRVLMFRFDHSAMKYAGNIGKEVQRRLAIGIVKNESVGQLVRRLMKIPATMADRMTNMQKADKVASAGFFSAKWEAERLVRTEKVNAYNALQIAALKKDNATAAADPEYAAIGGGGWWKKWDATNDKRTCGICHDLDGKIVPLNQPFPGGVDHPPIHPCDRCAVVPWQEGWS